MVKKSQQVLSPGTDLRVNGLYNFVGEHDMGEVSCACYDVFLDNRNAFQPDIIFIANGNLDEIKEDGIYGAPDVIIRILSPGTAQYDRVKTGRCMSALL